MTVLLTRVVATWSVRCEPPYSLTMGRHFITVLVVPRSCCSFRKPRVGSHFITDLFTHGAVATRRASLLTDSWDNRSYDEGRSMRFPSELNRPCSDERVYWKKSLDHTHE
jgi:hypothetical protein